MLNVSFASCPGLSVVISVQFTDEPPAAVCPECGCTSGVGRSTLRPHNAGAKKAVLPSGSASGRFQNGHPGLLVTVWHGYSFHSADRLAGFRQRSSSAVSCQLKDVSSDRPAAAMETEVLLLQVRGCGTVCQLI